MQNDTSASTPSVLTTVFRIEPLIVSYIEISLAIAALIFSASLSLYIIYFYLKKHETITKNHKRMIIGVIIMCIMECLILVFRIIYDSFNISFGLRFQNYASSLSLAGNHSMEGFDTFLWYNNTLGITPKDVGITMGEIIIYVIAVAAELFIILMDIQVMVVIVWFVTLVFVETFRITSGMLNSKKVHYFVNIVTVFTIINSLGLVVINLVVTILTIVQRLGYISDDAITYVYGLCLIIFVVEVGTQIAFLIIAATIVLKTISKVSIEKENKTRSIIKVLVLQSGLFGCFLFEAFAAGCGIAQEDPLTAHFALGYSTSNTLGILIFACTALALYTPFHALGKKDEEKTQHSHHQYSSHVVDQTTSLKSNNLSSSAARKKYQHTSMSRNSYNNNNAMDSPTSSPRVETTPRLLVAEEEEQLALDTNSQQQEETVVKQQEVIVEEQPIVESNEEYVDPSSPAQNNHIGEEKEIQDDVA